MPATMALGLGLVTGLFAGVFGIGGGVVLIPLLVFLFKYPQHQANGISLMAMLLPVGLLGVWEYYKAGILGPSEMHIGLWIAFGIFIGAAGGAFLSVHLSGRVLQKAFAIFLALVALEIRFKPRIN